MGISTAAEKIPENKRSQIDLLYRDIKIQMNELRELRPYKAAIDEIIKLIEFGPYSDDLQEVGRIILNHIKN